MSSHTTPIAQALDAPVEPADTRRRLGDGGGVGGSWPAITSSSSGGVGHSAGEGADLVERRGERHQAVARHPPVGGLQADDAAQRGGLADRAAGVGAERQRREAGGDRGALPPQEPPGTRVGSCGLLVGPKAEFSVEQPIANSSRFVLPTMTPPAAASRSTTVAS